MPLFNPSPFAAAVRLLTAGVAEYFFGSWKQDASPCQMYVTSVALNGNVATLGVTVYGGDAPAVGSLISTAALTNATFNATNQALTAVAIGANGSGTVSFALAGTNLATTADAGRALVPIPVAMEAIANGASVPVAMPNNSWGGDLDNTVSVQAIFGTLPTAVTITLQGSMVNQDSAYQALGTVATVPNSAQTANGLTVTGQWLFYRVLVSGLNGAGTFAVTIEA